MRKKKQEIAAPKAAQVPASSENAPLDVDSIRELASIVESHGLSELRLTLRGGVLLLRRGERGPSVVHSTMPIQHAPPQMMQMMPAAQSMAPVAAPASEHQTGPAPAAQSTSPMGAAAANGQVHYVNSPFVGTFYRSPSPEAPSFVEVGQRVKKGQVLCIVEAMKLMNEIEAEVEGTIVACLAENAKAVEYGQTLFKISP
jgi:acetyl-CoA carboxylase biotin carboxyl carrier protein